MPEDFHHGGKSFLLKGFILDCPGHFTSLIRMVNAWMFCDGLNQGPKFTLFPLKDLKRASAHHKFAMIVHEVAHPLTNCLVGSPQADLNSLFVCRNTAPLVNSNDDAMSVSDESLEAKPAADAEEPTAPEGLSQDEKIEKLEEMQKALTSQNNSKKWGFSRRLHVPTRGQKPRCKGCKKTIDCSDVCLLHNWKKDGDKHASYDRYHLNVKCLGKLRKFHWNQLTSKDWSDDPVVDGVVKELK